MAFPDLQLETSAVLHAVAEGVPDNGNNTIGLPFRPEIIDPDKLVVNVYSLGASVSNAQIISVDPINAEMVISFDQIGVDQARVEAVLRHTTTN